MFVHISYSHGTTEGYIILPCAPGRPVSATRTKLANPLCSILNTGGIELLTIKVEELYKKKKDEESVTLSSVDISWERSSKRLRLVFLSEIW